MDPNAVIPGLLSDLGLDGSVFSNPMEWPNVKAAVRSIDKPPTDTGT